MFFLANILYALVISLLIVSPSVSASGDSPLKSFSDALADSSLSFTYSYEARKGKTYLTGSGSACIQGDAYMLYTDGVEVICDGKSLWSVDKNAKEAVIETVLQGEHAYKSNPVLLIRDANQLFRQVSSSEATFNGEQVLEVKLVPVLDTGLSDISLYFKDNVICGAAATAGDGTETVLIIRDFRYGHKKDLSHFVFDDKSLDSSWIVTDLR